MKNCKFRRKHCKFRRLLAQVLFLWYNNNAKKEFAISSQKPSTVCSFSSCAISSFILSSGTSVYSCSTWIIFIYLQSLVPRRLFNIGYVIRRFLIHKVVKPILEKQACRTAPGVNGRFFDVVIGEVIVRHLYVKTLF